MIRRSVLLAGAILYIWDGSTGVLAQTPAAPAAGAARPSIEIPRVSTPPRLEDFLNGTPPGAAVSDFRQREPHDQQPASEQTTAYLSYDGEHLYVGFVCTAKDPSSVRAHMLKREDIFSDDWVGVLIDTFHDRQRSYFFASTPLGIQLDGIVTDGQNDDFSFDTLWQTHGRLTPTGYVVLFAVPFKSMRFPPASGPQTWGLGLARAIPQNSETSFWPGITNNVNGFVAQYATMTGLEGVSPGRNVQLIPYQTFTAAHFLDRNVPAYDSDVTERVGIDGKLVLHDSLTVDLTANPDFSQVESDEPQVTINQRFEVFFPEKRPFFIENAGYFSTPNTLFFSRRIHDPQFGGRMTGKTGSWAIGALTIDDRDAGRDLPPEDPAHGDRAFGGVFRALREFPNQSRLGGLVTLRNFAGSYNRVASADTRVRLNKKWFAVGQAIVTDTKPLAGTSSSGGALYASVERSGNTLAGNVSYTDFSPDFHTDLGFIPRTDIRRIESFWALRARPKTGFVTSWGPNSYGLVDWDYRGVLQDWIVRFPFEMNFKGQTNLFVRHVQSGERFEGIMFRERETLFNFFTNYWKALSTGVSYAFGTRPNYYPGPGLSPFLADFNDIFFSLTVLPVGGLRLDETYIYSGLRVPSSTASGSSIFDNHIIRSRASYQFNRELSLRAIVDYNAVLANPSLVALDRTKHVTADILLTYLVHPGTAVYVGFTDGFDNVRLEDGGLSPITNPTTSTGRQIFVKTSYLFRF
jgi:hypothetical protein